MKYVIIGGAMLAILFVGWAMLACGSREDDMRIGDRQYEDNT